MSTKITDNRVNMDSLIKGLKDLNGKSAIVGVMEDESKDMQIIASSMEFGAEIKSKKAIYYLYILLRKYKLINMSPKKWMEKKQVIKIPERSYIRSTFDDREVQNKIVETMRFYLFKAMTAQNTFDEVLSRAGNYLMRQIQARMKNTPPPNHPLTEAMKGHNETLVGRTKKLMKAIKSRIVSK